jgi:hypothetical protein
MKARWVSVALGCLAGAAMGASCMLVVDVDAEVNVEGTHVCEALDGSVPEDAPSCGPDTPCTELGSACVCQVCVKIGGL